MSKEVIICPYCNEEQEYQGGRYHSEVFFSEGNHKLECYQCGEVFQVNTETRYVYEVEEMKKEQECVVEPLSLFEYGDMWP